MDRLVINSAHTAVKCPECFFFTLIINLPPNWARQECLSCAPVQRRACSPCSLRWPKQTEKLSGLPILPRPLKVVVLRATHSSSLINYCPVHSAVQHRHFLPSTRLEPSSLAYQLSPLVFQPAGFSAISFPVNVCRLHSRFFDLHPLHFPHVPAPHGQACRVFSPSHKPERAALLTRACM